MSSDLKLLLILFLEYENNCSIISMCLCRAKFKICKKKILVKIKKLIDTCVPNVHFY
jgi:hypothetical protein